MVDAAAFRDGVARLLAEVQRIKSEGDYAAAKALFETYGVHFDAGAARRDCRPRRSPEPAVLHRIRHAQAAGRVTRATASITDVEISYPCDLTTQMLEFSERTPAPRYTDIANTRPLSIID